MCIRDRDRTTTLTIKVTIPMDNPELIESPCAITVHGELPINENYYYQYKMFHFHRF